MPDGVQTYFSFNQSNGDIAGGSILPGLQAVDDFGNTTQFVPAPDGGYEVYIPAQGGTGVQVLLDGNVTDSTQVSINGSGYAHVQANDGGAITNAEGLSTRPLLSAKSMRMAPGFRAPVSASKATATIVGGMRRR